MSVTHLISLEGESGKKTRHQMDHLEHNSRHSTSQDCLIGFPVSHKLPVTASHPEIVHGFLIRNKDSSDIQCSNWRSHERIKESENIFNRIMPGLDLFRRVREYSFIELQCKTVLH